MGLEQEGKSTVTKQVLRTLNSGNPIHMSNVTPAKCKVGGHFRREALGRP